MMIAVLARFDSVSKDECSSRDAGSGPDYCIVPPQICLKTVTTGWVIAPLESVIAIDIFAARSSN